MTTGPERPDVTDGMRIYWDERARENAVYYVDTTCSYDAPDMEQFFETGNVIVRESLLEAPVRPRHNELAVEIGPGLGRICKALAPCFDRVVGIDVSAEMVGRARQLVDDRNVTFAVGDGVTLGDVGDASADFVITFTVLQHVPDRQAIVGYLREAARVLRPGGVLAAQWNGDAHPVHYRIRTWWWRTRRRLGLGGGADNRLAPEFLGTPVPVAFVKGVLEDAGLVIRGTKGEGTLFSWIWAAKP